MKGPMKRIDISPVSSEYLAAYRVVDKNLGDDTP